MNRFSEIALGEHNYTEDHRCRKVDQQPHSNRRKQDRNSRLDLDAPASDHRGDRCESSDYDCDGQTDEQAEANSDLMLLADHA